MKRKMPLLVRQGVQQQATVLPSPHPPPSSPVILTYWDMEQNLYLQKMEADLADSQFTV